MLKDVDRTVSTTDARKRLSDLIASAAYASERSVITRNGKPMAAIVSIEDLEAMEALEDMMDIQKAKESLEDARQGGGTIALEEFEKKMRKERGAE